MPVPLRTDFDAAALRAMARTTKDGPQARRLLALAAIYEGATRTEAARIGGVTVQIVRDWVVKFNAHGPEGLVNRKPPGQPSQLTDAHRAALQAIIEQGPIPAIHGVVRWRLVDLIAWVWEEFRITISKQTLSRELRALVLVDQAGWHQSKKLVVPATITHRDAMGQMVAKMSPSSLEATPMERPMAQQLDDLSRSLTPLEQDSTIIAVIEMSQASWLVAGIVPGIERHPLKKLEPSEVDLLRL